MVALPTAGEVEYLRAQVCALRQSLHVGKVRQEKLALQLQQRAGEWENERAGLKQRLDWCESVLNNERQKAFRFAEEAAEAQHQLSLLEVERNRLEEQLGCVSRAYSQLAHRAQILDRAARLLDSEKPSVEQVNKLKETVLRLKGEVRELETIKAQKRELENLCQGQKAELIKARDGLQIAGLTCNRAQPVGAAARGSKGYHCRAEKTVKGPHGAISSKELSLGLQGFG